MKLTGILNGTTFLRALPAVGLLACSVPNESYSTDADTGSRHASVQVERSSTVNGPQRASVVAGFVQLPASADRAAAMRLVGMGDELPAVGQCNLQFADSDEATSGPVEFMDAGDVTVTVRGEETLLAARALPTLTDLISGVVYTTPDQDPEPLPAGDEYTIHSTGGLLETTLDIRHSAPDTIEVATVGGTPLAEVEQLTLTEPLDLTWSVGSPDDILYAEVSVNDASYGCSFRDDVGAGTLAIRGLEPGSQGRISLRRIRSEAFSSNDIESGEIRFDFELAHSVTVVE